MKRKALAWTAALLIIAAVSACFLRPIGPITDAFGYADDVFVMGVKVPITDCEGDTDMLRAESIVYTKTSDGFPVVNFSTEHELAVTTGHYQDGELLPYFDFHDIREGMVEYFQDGEWVVVDDDLNTSYALIKGQRIAGSPPYNTLSAQYCRAEIYFPYTEPGVYRVTYFFREVLSDELYHYTLSGKQYSISHTITIPEKSDRPFDVLRVNFRPQYETVNGTIGDICAASIRPYIRANNGDSLYIDLARGDLEVFENGEWVEAPANEKNGFSTAVKYYRTEEDDNRYIDALGHLSYTGIRCCINDPSKDYRLTLYFAENEDGSGKQYTLQLHLRFEE